MTDSEEELYADSAYRSETINEKLAQKGIKNKINQRAYRNNPLTQDQKEYNKIVSSVRYVVERTFGAFKRHYGADKTRFLDVKKTHGWITTIAIAHNLKKAAVILYSDPPGVKCA